MLQGLKDDLQAIGAKVVAIVGDNAPALQLAIVAHCNAGIFPVRCAAHSIQLIVKDVLEVPPLSGCISLLT